MARRYAIISDIHANPTALRTVLADARSLGADSIVCLGDTVGYGPLPAETLRLVRASSSVVIAGNHDDAVSGRSSADAFIDLAADAVHRHRDSLSRDDLDYLSRLPYTARIDGALISHGDFSDPAEFHYIDTESDALDSFSANDSPLMFVGHTHIPCIFVTGQSGNVYRLPPQDFVLEPSKRYIVNPGSVGFPRENNGRCLSSYIIYDPSARTVVFRTIPFAISGVLQRGQSPHHPRRLLLLAAALASSLLLAAVILLLAPKPETPSITIVKVESDPAILLQRRTVTLAPSFRFISAGLLLAKKSDPVQLTLEFKDAGGNPVGRPIFRLVKSKSSQSFPIPPHAVSAHFTLSKLKSSSTPSIVSFDPRCSAAPPPRKKRGQRTRSAQS